MPTFSENATTRLSALLGRPFSGKVITSEHRAVIAQVCDDAKASGLTIEQIIVALKGIFAKVPSSDGSAASRTDLRDRVIAVCIEEYFNDGKAGRGGDGQAASAGDGKAAHRGDGKTRAG